ncbi:MAG TPA: hypothetical protein VGG33_05595, partial [Polyangia bacterium]
MNLAGILVGGGLVVAVVAEGAYIVHTRSEVEALSAKLEALESAGRSRSSEDEGAREGQRRRASDDDRAFDTTAARPSMPRPVPRFVTEPEAPAETGTPTPSGDPLPLPPALSSPEAREQLRQFVLA